MPAEGLIGPGKRGGEAAGGEVAVGLDSSTKPPSSGMGSAPARSIAALARCITLLGVMLYCSAGEGMADGIIIDSE